MPPWGSKWLTDRSFGKANRHRQEDKQRRANASAQGLTHREYQMMAPFNIPLPTANAVSYPRRRYPIPPHHPMDQRPHRGPFRPGHPVGRVPFPQPLHPFYPPHHLADLIPTNRGFRPGRRPSRFIEEDFDDDTFDTDNEDDDDDDDDDDGDDTEEDFDFMDDLIDRRSYTRDRHHRRHPGRGNIFAHRDHRAIMPPRGHHHGMHGSPFGGRRGVYGDPYATRGYSDTESTVTW